jgi:hypothetical protein
MCDASDDARLLALYLLTGQHANMIGCFRLPDGYISEDIKWGSERVSKAFDELFQMGFVTRETSSKWVFIRNFMTWNQLGNPNQGIGALRLFEQVPDKCCFKPDLARSLLDAIAHLDRGKLKGRERVLERFRNQEQEQEQNINPTHNARGDLSDQITNGPPNVDQEFLAGVSEPIGKFSMLDGWRPSPDFRRRAATWGVNLPDPEYLPAELASFSDYWISEGKVFTQVQWEQKFARHIVQVRAKPETGGKSRAGNRTGSTASRAVQEIDAAYEEWQRRHGVECGPDGMASMAGHGGNIFEPLEPEERGGAFGALDSPDRFDD